MTPREEIEALLAARAEALARFDADAVMCFYTQDAELILNDLPTFSGAPAIRDFFTSMFAEGTFEPEIVIEDLRVEGTLAVFYARQLLTVASTHEPITDQFAMRHMATLSKASGGWLIVRSMVTLEGPGSLLATPLETEA